MEKRDEVMIDDLIRKNRSCRRFYQEHAIDRNTLEGLVNLARLSASAANLQPLRYVLCCDRASNAEIFSCLGWAGYLKDWPGPAPGEQPAAYIIMLADMGVSQDAGCDHGIAAQSILLGARDKGLAGCMIGSANHKQLKNILDIPDRFQVLLVLAIGKPVETAVIETVGSDGSVYYWRDADGVHHVPKRKLEDIVIAEYGPQFA
jgi:nitroreductase